jgi:hypothetical protein
MTARTVRLYEIANARSGDKGNRLNIALVCRDPAHYSAVARHVTAERVAAVFAGRKPSRVVRYDLPKLAAFNFVLDDVLEGGVTQAWVSTATASRSRICCSTFRCRSQASPRLRPATAT